MTISVLDGPLKQMKDIHRPSSGFLCYSCEGEEGLMPPVDSKVIQLNVTPQSRVAES